MISNCLCMQWCTFFKTFKNKTRQDRFIRVYLTCPIYRRRSLTALWDWLIYRRRFLAALWDWLIFPLTRQLFSSCKQKQKKHVTNAYLKLNVYVCLQCGTHGKMHCFLLKIHSWKNIASEYFKTKSIRRINYMYNFNDIPWSEIQAGHSVLCFYQFNILLIALSLIS